MSPDDYLVKARRALASARLLLADGDVNGACNRAYYAMFDAAQAALMIAEPGLDPAASKTHSGLIAMFGRYLVKSGVLPSEAGRALNQVERVRLLADYTGEVIDEEKVYWAIDQAVSFLEAIEGNLLPGGGKPAGTTGT